LAIVGQAQGEKGGRKICSPNISEAKRIKKGERRSLRKKTYYSSNSVFHDD